MVVTTVCCTCSVSFNVFSFIEQVYVILTALLLSRLAYSSVGNKTC